MNHLPASAQRRWKAVVQFGCFFVMATAVATLAGWSWDVEVLKCWMPGLKAMNPLSALGLLAAAEALRQRLIDRSRLLPWCLALVPLTLGALHLLDSRIGWHLEIDRILFSTSIGVHRMTPSTAFALVLLGASLLTIDVRLARCYPAEVFAILGVSRSLIAIVGWIHGATSLYLIQDPSPGAASPAVNSICSLLLLNLGVLSVRPNRGAMAIVSSSFNGGVMARRLLPIGIAIPIVLGLLCLRSSGRGDFDADSSVFLLVTAAFACTLGALLWTAAALNRLDAARERLIITQHSDAIRLAESEELYRITLSNVSDTIIITDESGRLVYVSPSVSRSCGYDATEAYELGTIDALVGPQLRERIAGQPESEIHNVEYQTVDKSGRTHDYLVNVQDVVIRGGTRLYVFRDVTSRMAAEAELRREQTFCEHVVNNAPLLIVALRPDGMTDFVNSAVTHATGYLPEELIGRNWWRLLYPGESHAQVEMLLGNEDNFRMRDYEMTLTTKAGQKRTISWNAVNMLDAKKRPTTIIGLGRDVTEQKRLEEELRQAQRMEAIGRLATGIAHDFNNLLTIILGNRDLVADACKDRPAALEPLHELGDAAARAADLTRQLLAFTRRQQTSPRVLILTDLVRSFTPLLRRLLGASIDLVTRLDPNTGSVEIDPAQFEQILLNLAINARDAMPAGGQLTIATTNVEFADTYATPSSDVAPGSFAELLVADTGTGMSPGVMEHVFEPFYTTKEVGKGTGMGLATVFGAVKQSNGYIILDSELGKGSTFRIYLPDVAASPSIESIAGNSLSFKASLPRATILIVEDEPAVRQIARNILEAEGYQVMEANSCENAMELLDVPSARVDLLLADVAMPDRRGTDLANALAKAKRITQVLLMSGYSAEQIESEEDESMEWSYLEKPFSRSQLLDAVSERLCSSALT
jgi:two-component system cell cycle sensor histidine kinase/response regulator CckA